jgi:hypothetical protein
VMHTRQWSNSRNVGGGAYGGNGTVMLWYAESRKGHETVDMGLQSYRSTRFLIGIARPNGKKGL